MAGEGFKIADAYADITANDNTAAGVESAKAQLDTVTDKKVTIDVDTSKGISSLTSFDTASTKSLGMFTAITAGAGAAAAAIGAMPAAATALGGAVAVLGISFNGVDDAMKAYQKDMDASGQAGAKFEAAMKKLSPPQQDFVKQLIETNKELKPLRDATSQAFLPGLTEMLKDSNGLFPIFQDFLTKTGTIMGDTAKKMGELFKTDEFKQNLQTLESSALPVTQAIGDAFVKLTDKLVEFGAKMQPAAQGFADFIKDASQGISDFLDELAPHAESFKTIFDALGTILKDLLPVIGDIAGDIADSLAPALKTIADWMDNNKDKIKPIVEGLLALWVALKAAGLVADVTKWVTGVVSQFDRLLVAIKKIPKGLLGGAALVGGMAIADNFLPGSTADDPDSAGAHDIGVGGASVGYSDLKGFTGASNQLLTDPGSVFKEIGDEWNQLVEKFKTGQSPIGAAWQAIAKVFTETIPTFFSQTIPQKLKTAWTAVSNFFTLTIPAAFTTIKQTLTEKWQLVVTFFTVTIPEAFTNFKTMLTEKWQVIVTFFTTTVPQAWDAFKTMLAQKWQVVVTFFTQDIPLAWDAFKTMLAAKWKVVTDFFTQDIPLAWDAFKTMLAEKWKVVTDFFTNDIPTAWDAFKTMLAEKWKAVTDFFTNDIPQAWDTFVQMLKDKWQAVADFFSKTIPDFLGTVPGLLNTAFQKIISAVTSFITNLGNTAAGASSGPSGNSPSSARGNLFAPMANGGIMGGLTPMSGAQATVVPPNTWRIVGDNLTHPELFAPLDGSQRSLSLLKMAAGTFGQQLVPNAAPTPSASVSVSGGGGGHDRPINIYIQQPPSSAAETGRMVALALRTAG